MSTNPTDAQLHIADKDGNYIFVHPETNFTQVLEQSTGKNLEDYLKENVGTVLKGVPYSLVAATANQTTFTFEDNLFNPNEIVSVYLNGEFMHPGEEYSITKTNSTVTIVLTDGVDINDRLFVYIHRNFKVVNDQIPIDFSTVPDHSIDEIKINYKKDKFGFYHVGGVKYFDDVITIYIDPINGDDNNDGKILSPIRSLDYLSTVLSNTSGMKPDTQIIVELIPGNYVGKLDVVNFDSITINCDSTQSNYAVFNTPFTYATSGFIQDTLMRFHNGTTLWMTGKIKLAPVVTATHTANYIKTFICTHVKQLRLTGIAVDEIGLPSKYKDTPNAAVRIDNTNAIITNCKFNNSFFPIYSDQGKIYMVNSTLDNCGSYHFSYDTIYSDAGVTWTNRKSTSIPIISINGFDMNTVKNGVIVESSYNSNGTFVKFADGTMICTHQMTMSSPTNTPEGNIFRTQDMTWVFPVKFLNWRVHFYINEFSGQGNCWGSLGYMATTPTQTSFNLKSSGAGGTISTVGLTAIGRWK